MLRQKQGISLMFYKKWMEAEEVFLCALRKIINHLGTDGFNDLATAHLLGPLVDLYYLWSLEVDENAKQVTKEVEIGQLLLAMCIATDCLTEERVRRSSSVPSVILLSNYCTSPLPARQALSVAFMSSSSEEFRAVVSSWKRKGARLTVEKNSNAEETRSHWRKQLKTGARTTAFTQTFNVRTRNFCIFPSCKSFMEYDKLSTCGCGGVHYW
jgi:hypothetical protein